jgi:DNA-directed RNA polymerase specialized sigma24 family protein
MRTSHRVDQPRHKIRAVAIELGLIPAEDSPQAPCSVQLPAVDPQLRAALVDAMALLSADDRLILELRFRDQQPLTRIARILKVEVRPLQRRIDNIKHVLRDSLLTQGVALESVDDLLRSVDNEPIGPPRKWWRALFPGPISR